MAFVFTQAACGSGADSDLVRSASQEGSGPTDAQQANTSGEVLTTELDPAQRATLESRVVFLGTSLTAGAGLANPTDRFTDHILVHTGQHYDDAMSGAFFRSLELRSPDVNLNIGSGPHGWQTGRMLEGLEALMLRAGARPRVLVYGDCNSTLAAALAAAKLGLRIDHMEA
ncbi:MAG TPA: hypothetical protein EYQ64_06305, partial [Gemmatimonadetes bacterium]|nr:hypothetical protein [Gemmatimonadota bacterium]